MSYHASRLSQGKATVIGNSADGLRILGPADMIIPGATIECRDATHGPVHAIVAAIISDADDAIIREGVNADGIAWRTARLAGRPRLAVTGPVTCGMCGLPNPAGSFECAHCGVGIE
jgi:hypothetical protein